MHIRLWPSGILWHFVTQFELPKKIFEPIGFRFGAPMGEHVMKDGTRKEAELQWGSKFESKEPQEVQVELKPIELRDLLK